MFIARQPPVCKGLLIIEIQITLTHTTRGTTPLDECSARCRDFYLTTHNTHKRQTSMPPVGFELAIPASERPQTNVIYTRTYLSVDPISFKIGKVDRYQDIHWPTT
jgi:hypothetical protein